MPESEPMETCSIEGCHREKIKRGWCNTHYQRWRNHGDPSVRLKARNNTPEEAFEYFTTPEPNTGCLLWTGSGMNNGYGSLGVNGRTTAAHRYAWERARGPIPEGMEVNHRCWTRACVNVEHLDLATRSQNQTYRMGPDADRTTPEARGIVRRVLKSGESRYDTKYRHTYYGTFPTEAEAIEHITRVRASMVGEQFAGR